MPHAVIEYAARIADHTPPAALVSTVHTVMCECGVFDPASVKTRAYAAHDHSVGLLGSAGTFVHVTVSLLEGRTASQKKALSDQLVRHLRTLLPAVHQITADIRDMDRGTYGKDELPPPF